MDDNIAPYLSEKGLRIMKLFKQYGDDMEKLLAAHPEITANDVAQVTREVLAAMDLVSESPGRAKRARRGKNDEPAGGYQIKITLRGSKPPIWRRVVVPGTLTLAQMHDVIQTAMGWYDCHLHLFEINGKCYSGANSDGYQSENGELDESEYRLCDVVTREKTKFRYEYDFGDGWEHVLVLEKIIAAAQGAGTITCLAGKGRCPPEDCGGIWRYYQLLKVLANPKDKEHRDMMEWVGGPIDPAEFDAEAVSRALAHIKI